MGDGGVEAGEVKAIGSSAASLDVIEVPRQPGADASSEARGASAEASAPLPLCYNARVSPCVWPKRPATQPRPPPRPPPSPPCRTLPPSATAARALVRSHAYRPARRAAGSCLCGGQSRAGCRCSRRSRRPPGTPQGAAPRARRCGAGTTLQRPGPSRSRAPQGELRKDAPGGGETAAAEEREREGGRREAKGSARTRPGSLPSCPAAQLPERRGAGRQGSLECCQPRPAGALRGQLAVQRRSL